MRQYPAPQARALVSPQKPQACELEPPRAILACEKLMTWLFIYRCLTVLWHMQVYVCRPAWVARRASTECTTVAAPSRGDEPLSGLVQRPLTLLLLHTLC